MSVTVSSSLRLVRAEMHFGGGPPISTVPGLRPRLTPRPQARRVRLRGGLGLRACNAPAGAALGREVGEGEVAAGARKFAILQESTQQRFGRPRPAQVVSAPTSLRSLILDILPRSLSANVFAFACVVSVLCKEDSIFWGGKSECVCVRERDRERS